MFWARLLYIVFKLESSRFHYVWTYVYEQWKLWVIAQAQPVQCTHKQLFNDRLVQHQLLCFLTIFFIIHSLNLVPPIRPIMYNRYIIYSMFCIRFCICEIVLCPRGIQILLWYVICLVIGLRIDQTRLGVTSTRMGHWMLTAWLSMSRCFPCDSGSLQIPVILFCHNLCRLFSPYNEPCALTV